MTKMNAQEIRRVSRNNLMQSVQQQVPNCDSGSNTLQIVSSTPRMNRSNGELDYTTYDWQSNAGAITRTIVWPDGKVKFAYTMATNEYYGDRGTGIGTYDAVNDEWIPSEGRVENQKTGFGSIARYGQNGIVVAAHTATDCRIYILEDKDNIQANSVPVTSVLNNTYEPTWPNVMTSGPNRNIIHVVATAYDHVTVPGMENVNQPILYFRSQDGGETWDIQNFVLPFMDANYGLSWGSNVCYWMESTDDNCLALVVNNPWSDGMVIYSYDNGDTWERKVFYKHPNPFGTFDNMFLYPRWTSCQWDNQHHLHVLYEFTGCSGTPESYNSYPGVGGVAYWNETMPYNENGTTQSAIAGNLTPGQAFVLDSAYLYNDIYSSWWLWSDASHEMWPEYLGYLPPLDDNGNWEDPYQASQFNIVDRSLHGNYHSSVCGFPVLCKVPGSDDMVAVWCAMDENNTDGTGNYYYKLFASYSDDGGDHWVDMVHLTNSSYFQSKECVYPQAAIVNNQLVIACQMDGETGSFVMGDDSDASNNYYQGLTFDLGTLFGAIPITATANPTEGGIITGAGVYDEGAVCTLIATANPGYYFLNWTEDGNVVSSDAEYTFVVAENRNLVANFIANHWTTIENFQNSMFMIGVVLIDGVEQASPALELGAFCNGECRGTEFPVNDGGQWLYFMTIGGNNGEDITFRLYDHALQQENQNCINVIPFEVYGLIGMDDPYEVYFSSSRIISASVNPENAGIVAGAGEYALGTEVILTASANPGYYFVNWTENGVVVSSNTEYSFIVTENRNLVANFISNHWTTSNFQNNMSMIGIVQIDGTEQASAMLELGAFCNGECRGSEFPVEEEGQWLYFMTIGGSSGDDITFRLYDHALQQELNLFCFNVIPFEIYGLIGMEEPYEVQFASMLNVSININPEDAGLVEGAGEYAPGTNVTLTATPNEGYVFNSWTLDGEIVSTDPSYTFTVTESVSLTANFDVVRTQQLVMGWNWWSTDLEITLDDLKAALVATGNTSLLIKSQGETTFYSNGRWKGNLSWDVSNMYKIKVSTACEITLEGTPINPAEHPVTIRNGYNWIAFPFNQSMSINAALAGFSAVSNDLIKSSTNNTIFTRGAWRGALTTFEPSQGYIFKSVKLEDRILTFPSSAK